MSLAQNLRKFRAGIAEINALIAKSNEKDNSGMEIFNPDQKDFIVTSSFLRMFIYWESFLESSFLDYLVGEASINNTTVNRYINPKDIDHASKILIGTQKYVDWANNEIVTRLACLYLENGEPFRSNMLAINSELSDLKTIRNAAAHLSRTTQPQLNALASRVLSKTVNNCKVSDFILTLSPQDNSSTILECYQKILDVAAENIAKNST